MLEIVKSSEFNLLLQQGPTQAQNRSDRISEAAR